MTNSNAVRKASALMHDLAGQDNLDNAVHQVLANKGAPGPDGVTVEEFEKFYFGQSGALTIGRQLLSHSYAPQPVRRTYIPKANGDKRPLGIPNVTDRVVQQALAQILVPIYEPLFHENSFGFRPGRSAQQAVLLAVSYLNEGYEWMIDLDIEKFFDRVNHDKLISIVRKTIPDWDILSLIRKFLKSGVMENGVKVRTEEGTPQGGPASPILSNIYLDELDKELDKRGLKFIRYADDVVIFVKSEAAANRVMRTVSSWIERKLFLKVSPTKTKVVRPSQGKFLGFGFYKSRSEGCWKCIPHKDSKAALKRKIKAVTCRRRAWAHSLNSTFYKLNLILQGWINYYCIGDIKSFMIKIGYWMRHRVRVVILKQWKYRSTIYERLCKIYDMWPKLQRMFRAQSKGKVILPYLNFDKEYVYAQCYTHCGWYQLGNNNIVNVLMHPHIIHAGFLQKPSGNSKNSKRKFVRCALVDPVRYFDKHKDARLSALII